MEGNQRPLSDFISSIEQVDAPVEIPDQDGQKPQKKKNNSFIIIVSILLVLIVGVGIYYFFTSKPEEEEIQNNALVEEPINVSEYTDIELGDYEGLTVEVSEGNQEEGLVNGIVTFKKEMGEKEY